MPLEEVFKIARGIGGEKNSFNYIAAPMNIVMPELFIENYQLFFGDNKVGKNTKVLDIADFYKINVMTTSPIMGGLLSQTPLSSVDTNTKFIHTKHLNLLRYRRMLK